MATTQPGLRACFEALIELPAAERAAWLDANAIDAGLRAQLHKMLAADGMDDTSVPLLKAGAAAVASDFAPESDDGAGLVGRLIGPYRLTSILGQGGTSIVFRAQRPMGAGVQTVALKLLRTGLFSADSRRRFRREQGVLSQLSHPNIAGLIDGGISDGGIPYIAMEFVDGLSITDYAQASALDLPARLRLLATVCQAVDSAHRALVVHKDLKPSNVLVNRAGEAKVLDFGIAQLLDDGSGQSAQTQAIALTPGYAAPEQYKPGPVTTATDIYALGVMLAELVTGRPAAPQAAPSLSRALAESLPPAGLPAAPVLRRQLRGDLDAIYRTACAAEPERRYGSAALLAEDLERYRHKRPVSARAPTLAYRLRKYVQRNRLGAAAAALSLLAVIGGVSATLWQARLAHEQNRRATAVSNFLIGLFEASRTGKMPEQRLTLEQLVHSAGERLQQDSDMARPTRIDMLRLLGEVGMAASDLAEAERLLGQALTLAQQEYAADDPAVLPIRLLQAQLLTRQTRYADAAAAYQALLPQIGSAADAASILALQNYALALLYSARAEQALAVSDQALQAATRFYGEDTQDSVLALLDHGAVLVGAGRAADAAAVIEPALQRWRSAGWPPDRSFLRGLTNLGRARLTLGDIASAERLAREDLSTSELIYQAPHEHIAWAMINLGEALLAQEKLDEAETLLTRALAMVRTIYGSGQMREANILARLGQLQWRRHDLATAAQTIAQGQQWCARPGLHPTRTCLELDTEETRTALALGRLDQAQTSSARGLAMAREIHRAGNSSSAELLQLRAAVQLAQGDATAALASCDEAQVMLRDLGAARAPTAAAVLAQRAAALEALQRTPEAQADIRTAVALWQDMAPEGYRRRAELLAQQARLQSAAGDAAGARASARTALANVTATGEIDPAVMALLRRLAGEVPARR